ncbi:MAG: hypothetical protein DSZ28_02295 [Thiothrix sp.]|nr:MAG: hypothetical protein DSZ28_02295 [Thiothrix sp.]
MIDHHYGISTRLFEPFFIDTLGKENLGILKIGHIAVISFFVLSGYVITWVLKNKYPHNSIGIKAFFLGRIIRIYPLYWAIFGAIVAAAFLIPGLKSAEELELLFSPWRLIGDFLLFPYGIAGFFLENNHYAYGMINLPAWTLPYDLVFYLVAPWMVMRKRILGSIIGLELLYLLFLSQIAAVPQYDKWHSEYLTTGHAQLLAFTIGAMAWYIRELRIPVWALVSAIVFMLYLVFVPYKLTNLYFNHLLVILLTVVIILGLKKRSPLDNLLGELTYSTYLLHLPVFTLVAVLGINASSKSLAAVVLTYVISIFVVKFIEAPIDKGRKFLTTELLKTAKTLPEKTHTASVYITVALFSFLLISAGYNLYLVGYNASF